MRVQLLALLAAAGVCHAADPEQWMVAHAPHFAVYSNSDAESTRSLAAGFERLHDLFATQPTAAQAANAAQLFGQDDDITILTLSRVPAPESVLTNSIEVSETA